MNYGALVSEAFWLAWRNRFLWFFGFFLGSGFSFNFNYSTSAGPSADDPGELPPWLLEIGRWISENLALFVFIVVSAVLVILLISITLSTIARAALTESVAALYRGETRRFGSTLRSGLFNFWRLLGLRALFFLISLGLSLVIFVPMGIVFFVAFALIGNPTGDFPLGVFVVFFLFFLLAVFLLILISVPLFIAAQLATRELVVGGRSVLDSVGGGFGLFWRNLGRSLLIWIIQVAIAIGTGIALLLVFGILGLILIGPAFLLFATDNIAAAVAVGVVGGLLFLIPYLMISGAVGTFNHAYWTLAYLRLTTPPEGIASQPSQST